MTDLPDVKLKAVLQFPANIIDGTGTDVSKINGKYRIDLAYDDFTPPLASIADPDNSVMLIWNTVSQQYGLAPTSLLLGASARFPSDDTPLAPGTAVPGTSLLYARGDHVHPAGDASAIASTPTGNVAATNVQAAIAELESEKVARSGDTMTGRLGIGIAPLAPLGVGNGVSYSFNVDVWGAEIAIYSALPVEAATLYLSRARGTQGTPIAPDVADGIGSIVFGGYSPDYNDTAAIMGEVDAAVTVGSMPTALLFRTGAAGAGTERLRIASNGKVTLTSPVSITDATQVPTKAYVDTQVATRAPLATISTSAPSGGVDGDVWYQVT